MFSRNAAGGSTAPAVNQPTVLAPPRMAPAAVAAPSEAPSSPPPISVDGGPVVVALTTAIPGHRGDISEVTLRAPSFGDWLEIGDIQRMTYIDAELEGGPRSARIEIIEARVGAWIKRLSGLHDAQIGKLTMKDGAAVYAAVKELLNVVRDAGN